MKGYWPPICVLVYMISVSFLHPTVKGADLCRSDKTAENHVFLNSSYADKGFFSLFTKNKAPRMTCAWQITAPPGYIVVLEIIAFISKDVGERSTTKVFDSNSTSGVLLWDSSKTSTSWRTFSLFSSGEHMRVVMETGNYSESDLGRYEAVAYIHKAADCTNERVFNLNATSSVAKFTSPYYPLGYPNNASCTWRIQTPPGELVRLQIEAAAVDNKDLQIYDENESNESLLWEFDWTYMLRPNTVIYSYTRLLLIKFRSGHRSQPFRGFEMKYSSVEPGCFANNQSSGFNASSGILVTTGFPADVPTQPMTCVWSFKASVGRVFRLDLNTLNLKNFPKICSRLDINYLSVYEPIKFECQNYTSRTLVSSGRRMQVMYTQPANKERRSVGVVAKYAQIPLVTTGRCAANQPGTINLKGEAATFHSLNYPKHHPGNMDCTWNITVNAGQVIEFHINPAIGFDCDKNEIRIYNGPTRSSPLMAKQCGYKRKVYSASNHLLVQFVGKVSSRGFSATFIARKAAPKPYACSSRVSSLEQMNGMVASWGFPLPYPNNVFCVWYIKVPSAYIVNFTISFLDIQPDPSCSKDYLLLLEAVGGSGDGEEIAKICGKIITRASYQSTKETMIVKFRSDATEMYPGFEAKFEAVKVPEKTSGEKSKALSSVTIVLIVVFSVLGVIGLTILIVWLVKYRYPCCADSSLGNFDMVKMDDTDDVKT